MDRTADGRPLEIPTLIDEFTKEPLAIDVARRICAHNVIDLYADVMGEWGLPERICFDYGPEMVVKGLPNWHGNLGTKTLNTQRSSQRGNGYYGSYNSMLGTDF